MSKIILINERTKMGITQPFVCQADNGLRYIVKTCQMMPLKQLLAEFIGTKLATEIGLPCPKYQLLHFDESILDLYATEWTKYISPNQEVFASEMIATAKLAKRVQAYDTQCFSLEYQKLLYLFDIWIGNSDRTSSVIGTGNINLIYCELNNKIYVIDHNLAFEDADIEAFEPHIFSPNNRQWQITEQDTVHFKKKAFDVLNRLDEIYQEIPIQWIPTDDEEYAKFELQLEKIRTFLLRITQQNYWETIK